MASMVKFVADRRFLAEHGKDWPTYAVREGIAVHNGETFSQHLLIDAVVRDLQSCQSHRDRLPATWEAAVVRFSDQIAYLGRDYEDACRLAIIEPDSLPAIAAERLGRRNGQIIDTLVTDLVEHSNPVDGISFSDGVFEVSWP